MKCSINFCLLNIAFLPKVFSSNNSVNSTGIDFWGQLVALDSGNADMSEASMYNLLDPRSVASCCSSAILKAARDGQLTAICAANPGFTAGSQVISMCLRINITYLL